VIVFVELAGRLQMTGEETLNKYYQNLQYTRPKDSLWGRSRRLDGLFLDVEGDRYTDHEQFTKVVRLK
jgi:hypothetical protein